MAERFMFYVSDICSRKTETEVQTMTNVSEIIFFNLELITIIFCYVGYLELLSPSQVSFL